MEAPKDAQPGAGPKRAGSGPKTLQDGSILAPLREVVVRAGGLEPPRPLRVCGFSFRFVCQFIQFFLRVSSSVTHDV